MMGMTPNPEWSDRMGRKPTHGPPRKAFDPSWPRACDNCPERDSQGQQLARRPPDLRVRLDGVPWYLCLHCFLHERDEDGCFRFRLAPRPAIDWLHPVSPLELDLRA